MTNLKRALSLMLVLALAIGMVAMSVSAAKFSDVPTSYSYSTEVQFLSDLGIIAGYPDGTYKPDGIITRAEAAAVIYRMLSGKQSAANYQGSTKFPDVTSENWASGYINFCVELGIVVGYPDGNFYPDKTLTYGEYITMLVRALGLDTNKDPSFPFGYIALASVEGVNENVDLTAGAACPRGAVAKLSYNAILNATYQRIANSIYVTEKPTIAKDVLKLKSTQGILTSSGDYDYVGTNPAGDKNFTLSTFNSTTEKYTPVLTGEYKVATSDLGKKATVWYKDDSTATNGIKVVAVVTSDDTEFSTIHVAMRGYYTGTPNQLTYVVNDVDKTLKLSQDCSFVENNEYIYSSTVADDKTDDFYPAYSRAWLPMSYKFIDYDKDGYYDFAIRTAYGFAEVTNITSSKVTLDGTGTIDRQDDNGNAYAWSSSLDNVSVGDYVLYTCDGAINTGTLPLYAVGAAYTAPNFTADLYDNTNNAKFIKVAPQTGTVQSIVDGEKVMIGDKIYRVMKNGAVGDLADSNGIITAKVGDEVEYYALSSFAMIAKAEATSVNTGKYLVVTGIAKDTTIGKDFTISAINENGKENTYTVKGDSNLNLTKLNGTEQGLTFANLSALVDADNDGIPESGDHQFFEYTLNSNGQITELKDVTATAGDTIANSDSSYSSTSGLLNTANGAYLINDSSLVYVQYKNSAGETKYKVFAGGYPTITTNNTTIMGMDTSSSNGTAKVKAMFVTTDATSITGSSSTNENLAGYLKSVTVSNDNGNWFYTYQIWYGGALKTYTSAKVSTSSELSDLVSDDNVIANATNLGGVVIFDVASDGTTISNMTLEKKLANYTGNAKDPDNDYYYGTVIVTNVDTANKLITVCPVLNATGLTNVTAGATLTGNAKTIAASSLVLGAAKTYAYTSNTNVYSFDVTSTNQAYAEVSSVGAIQTSSATLTAGNKIYIASFAYDDNSNANCITDIFYNVKAITLS